MNILLTESWDFSDNVLREGFGQGLLTYKVQGWLALIAVRCSALPPVQISPTSPQRWRQISLDILDTIEECSKHLVLLLSFAQKVRGGERAPTTLRARPMPACLVTSLAVMLADTTWMVITFIYSQAVPFPCMRTRREAGILGFPLHCACYGQRALSTNRLKFPFCSKGFPEYLSMKAVLIIPVFTAIQKWVLNSWGSELCNLQRKQSCYL